MAGMTCDALLKASGLCVVRDGRSLLRDVSVALSAGELVAVLGANGAGKSTLLQVLRGGWLPDAGEVMWADQPLAGLMPVARAQQIAYLPQQAVIHWPVSVRELVALGRYPHGEPDTLALRHPAVEAAMALADCAHLADRDAMTLSGGESVRVLLARALAVEAPVLLADEPLAGLDPAHQLDVLTRLKRWVGHARSAVVVMHDLTLAARFADRVWLLHEGRLIGDGAPDEVLTDERLARALGVQVLRGEQAGQRFMIPWNPLP